jgi:hypothetical protein
MGGNIYQMTDIISDEPDALHFNDLLYSSCYVPYYSWLHYWDNNETPIHFSIGASVACLKCGEADIDDDIDNGSMRCWSCEMMAAEEADDDRFVHCSCCDRRLVRRHANWEENAGGWLCDDCFNDETTACGKCAERWYNLDIVFNREEGRHLCPYCRGDQERPEAFDFGDWSLPF